ncbi:hemerythrin domain-containing protein [Massilia glaciei]|uniref:Hemerythrin n=1 Tax=Massilia glaciei TaxID=1524097 RepID=A0A2U2HG09_9BURK|nr:hemerythrin domain-containing protein [Massilia glaciei]PWF43658.1 hemerythrin [Massilia glaciei]
MKAKSNDAIALLTSDHREVADLFKQYEALGERAKSSKKRIADEVCTALTMHTTVEEEIFYPSLREAGVKGADELLDEAIVEHASAKELIAQLQEMDPEDELYDAKVKVLAEQIEHHVKEEEKEMFPMVRKAKLDLEALGQEITQRKEELAAAGV